VEVLVSKVCETTLAAYLVFAQYVRQYGRPPLLYLDRDSIYRTTESLVAPDWTVLGEVTLISPVETWFDSQPLTRVRRFYRAVLKN
jgi:hypothetical protein